jgi:hypothetical protein
MWCKKNEKKICEFFSFYNNMMYIQMDLFFIFPLVMTNLS